VNVLDDTATSTTRDRVVHAALQCLAAQGLRRTTVDDVASVAGISRATLYRTFPGGRDTILAAVVDTERGRLLADLRRATAGAQDVRGVLVDGIVTAATWLTNHAVLVRLMFDEPAVLLTHVEFTQMDETLAAAAAAAAPLFERFMAPASALRTGEFVTRIVLSYLLFPSDEADLTDRAPTCALSVRSATCCPALWP